LLKFWATWLVSGALHPGDASVGSEAGHEDASDRRDSHATVCLDWPRTSPRSRAETCSAVNCVSERRFILL
jgi:hypothetical protein